MVNDAVDQPSRTKNYVGVQYKGVLEVGAQRQLAWEKFDDSALGRFILVARALIVEAVREKGAPSGPIAARPSGR